MIQRYGVFEENTTVLKFTPLQDYSLIFLWPAKCSAILCAAETRSRYASIIQCKEAYEFQGSEEGSHCPGTFRHIPLEWCIDCFGAGLAA
jgi:hypothetical protein